MTRRPRFQLPPSSFPDVQLRIGASHRPCGEAGGYCGEISTITLVPQVVDAVSPIPVVAAGGIFDGRGIAAALMLGAAGSISAHASSRPRKRRPPRSGSKPSRKPDRTTRSRSMFLTTSARCRAQPGLAPCLGLCIRRSSMSGAPSTMRPAATAIACDKKWFRRPKPASRMRHCSRRVRAPVASKTSHQLRNGLSARFENGGVGQIQELEGHIRDSLVEQGHRRAPDLLDGDKVRTILDLHCASSQKDPTAAKSSP